MITRELSEQLIKAGFKGRYSPRLEEVIEACGDGFESLDKMEFEDMVWWQAYMTEEAFKKSGIVCVRDCCGYEVGDSPIEAVVRLFIELNEVK